MAWFDFSFPPRAQSPVNGKIQSKKSALGTKKLCSASQRDAYCSNFPPFVVRVATGEGEPPHVEQIGAPIVRKLPCTVEGKYDYNFASNRKIRVGVFVRVRSRGRDLNTHTHKKDSFGRTNTFFSITLGFVLWGKTCFLFFLPDDWILNQRKISFLQQQTATLNDRANEWHSLNYGRSSSNLQVIVEGFSFLLRCACVSQNLSFPLQS